MDMCDRNRDMTSVKEARLIIRHARSEGEVGPVCGRALGNFYRKLTASCALLEPIPLEKCLEGKQTNLRLGKYILLFATNPGSFEQFKSNISANKLDG